MFMPCQPQNPQQLSISWHCARVLEVPSNWLLGLNQQGGLASQTLACIKSLLPLAVSALGAALPPCRLHGLCCMLTCPVGVLQP